jgi:heterotetrameric sarcosine oxidase gamma subunit
VSALSFCSPDVSSQAIVARTPMERLARAAGAHFERRDGWQVATRFGPGTEGERRRIERAVAFVDRSSMTKLELHGEPRLLADVVASVSGAAPPSPGLATSSNGAWWCAVTPGRVLILGEPAKATVLRAAVGDAVGKQNLTVVELTCALAALSLLGPGSRELLARFCAIDVRPSATPIAGFRPGSIARTPGYLLREGEDRLLIMVGWALGEYLWQVVADAAEHLGGGPVGADAITERQGA